MKMLYKILFVSGMVLLGINIFGLFKTMRNPALYTEEVTLRNRIGDVTIEYPEIRELLKREETESNIDFAVRINKVVNDGMAHYWKARGIRKYNLRVPVWENYLLNLASYINHEKYGRYEFSSYKKNLERGVGLCSTHSIVVKGVLLDHGIKAELLDVGGHHVVVRAELNDTATWILDPDFGIVVPYDTAAISADPELVRAPYRDLAASYYADAVDPYTTQILVDIFGDRLHVYEVNNPFESISYWAIWIIPFLCMVPYVLYLQRRRKQRQV